MSDDNRPQGDGIRIYRANTQGEAQSLVLFLGSRGIRAMVQTDGYQAPVSIVAIEWALRSDVYINEEDQEKAAAAIIEFQALTRSAAEIEPDPKDQLEEAEIPWKEWPRCPECARKRITECPDCGAAGDDYALAEYQEFDEPMQATRAKQKPADEEDDADFDEPEDTASEDAAPIKYPYLDCPHCGEVFRPKFYRRCAHCTHIFPDGKTAPPIEKPKKFRWGPIIILGVVLLVVVALAVVFQIRTQFQQP